MAQITQIVEMVQSGEKEAFTLFFQETYNKTYFVALSILNNHDDALDITQETYVKAFVNIHNLRDSSAVESWLYKITVNLCRKFIDKKKEFVFDDEEYNQIFNIPSECEEFFPEISAEKSDIKEIILSLLNKLPYSQKEIVLLFYYEQLSIAEIMHILNISELAAKSRLFRARQNIRILIDKEEKKGAKIRIVLPIPILTKLLKRGFSKPRLRPREAARVLKAAEQRAGISVTNNESSSVGSSTGIISKIAKLVRFTGGKMSFAPGIIAVICIIVSLIIVSAAGLFSLNIGKEGGPHVAPESSEYTTVNTVHPNDFIEPIENTKPGSAAENVPAAKSDAEPLENIMTDICAAFVPAPASPVSQLRIIDLDFANPISHQKSTDPSLTNPIGQLKNADPGLANHISQPKSTDPDFTDLINQTTSPNPDPYDPINQQKSSEPVVVKATEPVEVSSKSPQTVKYYIMFHANGGTGNMADQEFVKNKAQVLSANAFTRTGYTFAGWSDSASGDVAYADKASVLNLTEINEATVNLYAVWEHNTYTVKFDANNGSGSMNSQTFSYDKVQDLNSNNFSRIGYTFSGWAISAADPVVYADKTSILNLTAENGAEINLYAVWTPNTYTVKFNANGGSGDMDNQSFTYDQDQSLNTNAFSRTNYAFLGWADSAADSVVYTDKTNVLNLASTNGAALDLYAVWKEEYITVSTVKTDDYDENQASLIGYIDYYTGSQNIIEYGFYWGTDSNPTQKIKADESDAPLCKEYSSTVCELKPYTTYYYRVYVLDNKDVEYYGDIMSFKTWRLGDINENEIIGRQDLSLLDQYLAGSATLTDSQKKAADVNKDGIIDNKDLDALSDYIKYGFY